MCNMEPRILCSILGSRFRFHVPYFLLFLAAPLACHTVFDGELHGPIACALEGAYGLPNCPAEQTCVSGVCMAVGAPIGHECVDDAGCRAPNFCFDPASIGAEGTPRCTRLCCASTDCGDIADGHVCWVPPGGGGSLCWLGEEIGRGALGTKGAGEACKLAEECRSGVCDVECVDLCCDSSYCAGGQICRTLSKPELGDHEVWGCGRPPFSSSTLEECMSHGDCASGRCLELLPEVNLCAEPCCSSVDCGYKVINSQKLLAACGQTDQELRTCNILLQVSSTGPLGSSCSRNSQCRSGYCLDGYCSDSCCTDASCGDISRYSCRPVEEGGGWALRCVRK
jgi:hypothetical protein